MTFLNFIDFLFKAIQVLSLLAFLITSLGEVPSIQGSFLTSSSFLIPKFFVQVLLLFPFIVETISSSSHHQISSDLPKTYLYPSEEHLPAPLHHSLQLLDSQV